MLALVLEQTFNIIGDKLLVNYGVAVPESQFTTTPDKKDQPNCIYRYGAAVS